MMLPLVPALLLPALALAAPTRLSVRSESGKLVRNDSTRGNQCLTALAGSNGKLGSGSPIKSLPCGSTDGEQEWEVARGSTQIKVVGTNLCLDFGLSPGTGQEPQLWGCYDTPPQKLYYSNYPDDHISQEGGNACLQNANGVSRVSTEACDASNYQGWHLGTGFVVPGQSSASPSSTSVSASSSSASFAVVSSTSVSALSSASFSVAASSSVVASPSSVPASSSSSSSAAASSSAVASSIVSSAAPSAPSSAIRGIHPGGASDQCLTVVPSSNDGSFANGDVVQIFPCDSHRTKTQDWDIERGDGKVQLHGAQDFCLDAGSTQANNTPLKIWQCYPEYQPQQYFYTNDDRIAITNGDQCADVVDGSLAAGTTVQTYQCTTGSINQVFTVDGL